MSDQESNNKAGVQADNNSIAVGGISAGGDISGTIHIGNVYNYASEEAVLLMNAEIEMGLAKFSSLLPERAPIMEKDFGSCAKKLRATLGAEAHSLSPILKSQREDSLIKMKLMCMEALDISFNALCRGENPPPYDSRPPFRGLYAFRPEDMEFYFGREELTQKLVARLKAHPFLAVLGASGSGKSSLVMAGLIPALEAQMAYFTPSDSPLQQLKLALENADENAVVVVDQFEELFTLTRDPKEREDFIHQLLQLTRLYRVVITMRADFWGEVASYKDLKQAMQAHQELIAPMDADELYSATEQQAAAVGLRLDSSLSKTILDEVKGEPGAMPLLQHALWMLWKRRHGLWLKADEYHAFGGVKQAIASTAEDVYASCSEFEREHIRDIFLRLTRLDDGNEGRDTRRRIGLADLLPSGRDAASVVTLLDKLANARLIVKTSREDRTEVEVAHEALIQHWERLRDWLNEDRDNLRLRDSVSEYAKEWQNAGRDKLLLNHRGGRLDDALLLGQNPRYGFTAIEQAYLNECVNAKNQSLHRRRRLQRQIITGLSGFISVVLILLVFVTQQLNISRARQLVYEAQNAFVAQNYNAAMLYAYQSNQIYKNEEADLILGQTTYKNFAGGRGLNGHTDSVRSVAWSAGGQLATGSSDKTVILWDLDTGQPAHILVGHTAAVISVDWSMDGQLASGADDGTVIIWNLNTRQPAQILKGHSDKVTDVSWSVDGQLASVSYDGTVIIWDLKTGQPARILNGHTASVRSVAWSADGQLASGADDRSVIIWDIKTEQPAQILIGHTDWVTSVAWSSDGKLASGSGDGTVIVWDIKTGQPAQTLKSHENIVYSVAWSGGGQLASVSQDTTVILWDLEIEEPAQILKGHTDWVTSLDWSVDGQLVTGSLDKTVILWDLKSNPPAQTLTGHADWVESVAWSADGKLASGSDDGKVIIWNPSTGQPDQILEGYKSGVWSVAWSVDGKLASGSTDGTVIIWDLDTAQPAQVLVGHTGEVYGVAWSADGKLASGSLDKTVIIWDLKTGKPAQSLTGHTDWISSVAWSANGQLASGSADGTVIVWDIKTEQPAQALKGHIGTVNSVAWSADGRLASGANDGTAIIWDLETGEPEQTLGNRTDPIYSVAWSANGQLTSGASDGTVVVWDIKSGQPAQTLNGHTMGRVTSVAWSADGRLASGGEDRTIKILEADIQPCGKIIRNMTLQEWLDYQGRFYIYQPACPNLYDPSTELNPLKAISLKSFSGDSSMQSLTLFGTWKGRAVLLALLLILLTVSYFTLWALYKSTAWAWRRLRVRRL
jgi:WD40 repeat protein/energy-coupling factor transporter ATP-binding protein EcfA2